MYCRKVTLKSGQIRWICVDDGPRLPGGKRNQIERRGKTQREAKAKVNDEIKRQKNTGVNHKLTKNMTFGKVSSEWINVYAASGVKRGSVRIREKEIKILNRFFDSVPIIEITHYIYQNTLIKLDKQGYAYTTISGVNTCANMIFKYAIRNKLMVDNPRDGAVVPKKAITVKELENTAVEDTYFEKEELNKFLDTALKIGLELDVERFYTLAFSGMRPGELIALKKSDLDFEDNTIRISKTLYSESNNMRDYTLDTTKTNKVRTIDMDEVIMVMLKKIVRKNDIHKMKYRTLLDDFHDEDFVFQRPNGYPFLTKNIADRMRRILKYAGIKKKLTPHGFRHTHISMLTESGTELPTIMERVGHEDPNTTLKIYTHITNSMKIKSVENVTSLHQDILNKIATEK